jgi:Fe-S cluster assembly scaffold protein SufB
MTISDIQINESNRVVLSDDELQSISVSVSEKLKLDIEAPMNTFGRCYIKIDGTGKLELNVTINENSHWSFLVMNQSDEEIEFTEEWNLKKNAEVNLAIGELTLGNHTKDAVYHLLEEGSSIFVRGASLVQSKLTSTIKAIHHKGHTHAQIDNYGIVLANCEYTLDVIGQIEKAAKQAKTHQISKVMNFGLKPKSSINPKLIIEENDVEASHAATIGQPDPLQVYYLQSRGMNKGEALKLISLGYLLPIIDVIEDEHVKEVLRDAVIDKVSNACLM